MAIRTDKVDEVLASLRSTTPDIIGSIIINMDGFVVASMIPSDVDEEIIGGMAAAIVGTGERIAAGMMQSEMEQVYIRSPRGYVIVNAVSHDSVIVMLVTREARLGLIFIELNRAVHELAEIMQS